MLLLHGLRTPYAVRSTVEQVSIALASKRAGGSGAKNSVGVDVMMRIYKNSRQHQTTVHIHAITLVALRIASSASQLHVCLP